ncbi:MAG TPA: GNAT family N-acetyltransferase [Ramlibacter sp.]|nr:GNAT family N-acetyltransferase [Ramlibacter sp.]
MIDAEIEAIERATVAAVSPQAQEELPGWLLPFDSGTVSRAKSAVPLSHGPCDPALLDEIEARYAAHAVLPIVRIPGFASFDPWRELLAQRGYAPGKPTCVETAATRDVLRVSDAGRADTAPRPDAAWGSVFLGEGFDPVDGASRVATLSRAPGALFASIREGDAAVAAGMAAFSHGWASVHGMRTAQHCRGRGLAGRVLSTLAQAALAREHENMFLQVEAENTSARALYRRAGFRTAWTYVYWKKNA